MQLGNMVKVKCSIIQQMKDASKIETDQNSRNVNSKRFFSYKSLNNAQSRIVTPKTKPTHRRVIISDVSKRLK